MGFHLKRTALCISELCNLKCKLCLAYIPYVKHPKQMSLPDALKCIDSYFEIVDTVDMFTITGGEPLLYPHLLEVFSHLYTYEDRILKSVDFVTNGGFDIPESLLNLFAQHRSKTKIVISDYGDLSPKVSSICAALESHQIPYRVSVFRGSELYYDGWIDFTDHTQKYFTIEERDQHSSQCIHSVGKYFLLRDGELHSCSRSYWRMLNGIIPKDPLEYVPLLDDNTSIEQKRLALQHMLNQKSSASCAYCVGLKNGVPRHQPAEQLR